MNIEQPGFLANASAPCPPVRTPARRFLSAAFSLVEVTLAIGVMGFAFVAIIGLVPVGLSNFRQTKNVSVASDIAARILSELQDTPFTNLVGATTAGQSWSLTKVDNSTGNTIIFRYFDDQGTELKSTDSGIVYQVNVCVVNAPGFVVPGKTTPPKNSALAFVTVQVAYVPGGLPPAYDGTTSHQFTGKTTGGGATAQIFNFNTYIAKNS